MKYLLAAALSVAAVAQTPESLNTPTGRWRLTYPPNGFTFEAFTNAWSFTPDTNLPVRLRPAEPTVTVHLLVSFDHQLVTNWTDLKVVAPKDPNFTYATGFGGVTTAIGWDSTPTRIQAGLVSSNVTVVLTWNGEPKRLLLESTQLPGIVERTIRSFNPQAP